MSCNNGEKCCGESTARCCEGFIRSRGNCYIEYGLTAPVSLGCSGEENLASLAILVEMTDLSFTTIERVVGSTTTSAIYAVPVNSSHQYYAVLVVCCADASAEVFTDCTWEFNGTSYVLVGSPSGCGCTSVPLVPIPNPPIGTRLHIPCESGPPE